MALFVRPSSPADVPAAAAIWHREEIDWFGTAQQSPEVMANEMTVMGALKRGVAVCDDDGTLVAFAAVSDDGDTALGIDPPRVETALAYLLPWLTEHVPHIDVPETAGALLAQLTAAGWHEVRTWLEMGGDAGDASLHAELPDGIELRTVTASDTDAVHHLIYVDAAWGDVRGHVVRSLESWQRLFVDRDDETVVRVAAWRGDRCVGWVTGAVDEPDTDGDRTAFVRQVAVATDERVHGLGHALLAHAFRTLIAEGGAKLGLHVQDANAGALSLYEAVGLKVTRTWLVLAPPPTQH